MGAWEASATEGGIGCGGGDGMRRCGPGEWRGRAGVEDDGGAAETSSTAGRGWATEARSKMGGGGDDRRVDRKVEDETVRYIGRDPLVPAGNTSRD